MTDDHTELLEELRAPGPLSPLGHQLLLAALPAELQKAYAARFVREPGRPPKKRNRHGESPLELRQARAVLFHDRRAAEDHSDPLGATRTRFADLNKPPQILERLCTKRNASRVFKIVRRCKKVTNKN